MFVVHSYGVWQCRKSQPSCFLNSDYLQHNDIESKLGDGYGGQVP